MDKKIIVSIIIAVVLVAGSLAFCSRMRDVRHEQLEFEQKQCLPR